MVHTVAATVAPAATDLHACELPTAEIQKAPADPNTAIGSGTSAARISLSGKSWAASKAIRFVHHSPMPAAIALSATGQTRGEEWQFDVSRAASANAVNDVAMATRAAWIVIHTSMVRMFIAC